MTDRRDFDGQSQLPDVLAALLALVLPAEQHELIPRLTGMVAECKGVSEHRGKLWGELSEIEGNVVANKVGVIAREILGTGRPAAATGDRCTEPLSSMIAATPLEALILEQTAEAVIYANREGVIERWNAAAAATFGYPAVEALGQKLDLMIPEHLRNAHWRGFDAAMASGKTRLGGRPTLTRGLHKSGKKLYVEMSFAVVLDDAGSTLGSVAVARDVTERVAREKAAAGGARQP